MTDLLPTTSFRDDLRAAQKQWPRLFKHAYAAGWSEDRDVDWPWLDGDPVGQLVQAGFTINDYAADFFDSFQGLIIQRRNSDRPGDRNAMHIACGEDWTGVLGDDPLMIRKLTGSPRITPVIAFGSALSFLRPDGTAITFGPPYEICIESDRIFATMDWILYRERTGAISINPIPVDHRPHSFRH